MYVSALLVALRPQQRTAVDAGHGVESDAQDTLRLACTGQIPSLHVQVL